MKKTKKEVNSGTYLCVHGESRIAPRAHWLSMDRAIEPLNPVFPAEEIVADVKASYYYQFALQSVESACVTHTAVGYLSVNKRLESVKNSLLCAIKVSHESQEEVGGRSSAVGIIVSDICNAYTVVESAAPLAYLRRESKGCKGKLEGKTNRDVVAVFNDLKEYIDRNKSMYSEWVSYARQVSVDDSGVIAGGKNKTHLSQ